ncbi:exo-alpha-sialidase [Schaalia canis]|nr:exo-alpha-sialidase [Schaalia canis]
MNTPQRRARKILPSATLTLALLLGMSGHAHALPVHIEADEPLSNTSTSQPGTPSENASTDVTVKAEENDVELASGNPQGVIEKPEKLTEPAAAENAVDDTPPIPVQNDDPLHAFASITMERFDANKDDDSVYVGDIVEWDITYTNKTTSDTLSFHPVRATIENTAISGGRGFCRWGSLKPGQSAHCRGNNLAFLRITQAHIGQTITPEVTFTVKKGDEVIAENYVVRGTPFTVKEGQRRDPSEVPTPRVDGQAIELARHNKAGFSCYRIPALTTAPNGDLLAAWDGRPDNCNDAPNPNSIVQRISRDGGQSWSAPVVIAQGVKGHAKYGYSDPSYVVDREANKIFMFFVKSYDQSYFGSRPGTDENQRNVLHAAVMESSDNGVTWGPIRTITADITPDLVNMRSRFAASGEGIQLRHPSHKGRLIQQFTYAVTRPGASEEWKAVSVYSDDHGQTWKAGVPVGAGMDENKVVELSDGTVMLNSRASGGGAPGVKARRVTYSRDGGHSYGEVTIRHDLVDQNNNAGLTRAFPDVPADDWRAKVIIFTNTANASARNNGTAKVSYDDGKTWAIAKEFYTEHTGYSTITPLLAEDGTHNSGKYGILFEKDGTGISYMQISAEWLGLYRAFPSGEDRDVKRGGNIVTFNVENRGTSTLEGATLTAVLPAGWKLAQSPSTPIDQADATASEGRVNLALPASIPAGEKAAISAKILVPADQDAGSVPIPLTLTSADTTTNGTVTLTVVMDESKGEKNAMCQAGVAITNNPPSETRNEATNYTNMLDGNLATFWHTPWGERHVPIDVEFSLTRSESLTDLILTNRADSKNGRIREAELSLLTNGEAHPVATIAEMGLTTRINLAPVVERVAIGEKATLRLHITGTDAESTAQRNTFASLAELCVREVYPSRDLHDEIPATPLQPSTPITPQEPPAPEPPAQEPPSQEPPASPSYAQGSEVRIVLKGFTPTSQVTFEVHSDPLIIGTTTANDEGVAEITWTIPTTFPAGAHTIVARDTTGKEVRQPIVITGTNDSANPPTHPGTPHIPGGNGTPQPPQKPGDQNTDSTTPGSDGGDAKKPGADNGEPKKPGTQGGETKKPGETGKKVTSPTAKDHTTSTGSHTALARTGASTLMAGVLVVVLSACGTGVYLMRRRY